MHLLPEYFRECCWEDVCQEIFLNISRLSNLFSNLNPTLHPPASNNNLGSQVTNYSQYLFKCISLGLYKAILMVYVWRPERNFAVTWYSGQCYQIVDSYSETCAEQIHPRRGLTKKLSAAAQNRLPAGWITYIYDNEN